VGTARPGSEQPTEHQALLRTATELLKAGQYDQVAELLHQAQLASKRQGDEFPARVLDMARNICMACGQTRTEAQWHQQACHEADRRERELRDQLCTILDLIRRDRLPETWEVPSLAAITPLTPLQPEAAKPREQPSLRQRIQSFLGRRPAAQLPKARVPTAPSHEPPIIIPERAAAPAVQLPTPEHQTLAVSSLGQEKPKEPCPPSLVVYCLGPFRVYQDDHLITDWESLKAKCILKYLVAHRGTPIVKDVLMDVFWKDAEPEAARRNLHQAVYSLRKTLRQRRPGFPYIWFEGDCYLLHRDTSLWLDFEQFEKYVRDGQNLEAAGQPAEAMAKYGIAEGLYQGDFLEEDLYEDWPAPQRQHLRTLYVQMADRLNEHYMQHGNLAAAIVLCRKILSLDSCSEEAHRRLMQCYLAQGQRHLAVRQYQACVQAMKEDLDLTPSDVTIQLYRRIITGV
jgi:DNA-binding SARP family transcriptional activator